MKFLESITKVSPSQRPTDSPLNVGSISARDTDAVFPGFTPQAATDVYFGRASWYDGYYLNASIDEVRLLDVPLSAAEIMADYASFP